MVLQDDTDVRKGSPSLHSETYTVSPITIKVEEVSDVEDEIVPPPVSWQEMKTELEVSCVPVAFLLDICVCVCLHEAVPFW